MGISLTQLIKDGLEKLITLHHSSPALDLTKTWDWLLFGSMLLLLGLISWTVPTKAALTLSCLPQPTPGYRDQAGFIATHLIFDWSRDNRTTLCTLWNKDTSSFSCVQGEKEHAPLLFFISHYQARVQDVILWLPCAVSEEKHKEHKVNNTLMKHSLCRPATSKLRPWILSSQGSVGPATMLRELWGIPAIPSPTSCRHHLPFPKQAGPSVKQLFTGKQGRLFSPGPPPCCLQSLRRHLQTDFKSMPKQVSSAALPQTQQTPCNNETWSDTAFRKIGLS